MQTMQWIVFSLLLTLGPLSAVAQTNRSLDEGMEIMTQKQLGNCVACHELPGIQGTASNLGPSLKGVGAKLTRETLTQWVKDGRVLRPNTLMPPFGNSDGLQKLTDKRALLTDLQIQKVVETLMTWRSDPSQPLSGIASERQAIQAQSGNAFLSPAMLAMQNDPMANPISLWLDKGQALWASADPKASCAQCHGPLEKNKTLANQFPKWSSNLKKLINLEDQIVQCSERTSQPRKNLEDPDVLALSALLHQQSKNQTILLRPNATQKEEWQKELNAGAELFMQRMGRMNLACTHCHDQNIGKRMQADIISPGHPTGFPIFKMNWQSMGSIDRRIRACYSGVQADIPPAGSRELRQLELFLKMRAEGLSIEGPSLRR